MASSALQKISHIKHLELVWRDMLQQTPTRKRNGYGVDRVSINSYSENIHKNIKSLSRAIRERRYRPSPLLPYLAEKPGGRKRVICVPTVEDRLVQRAILHFLNSNGYDLNNEISFGFVKGKKSPVKQAALRAIELRSKHSWVYKADIASFFDRIPRSELKSQIAKKVRYPSIVELLGLAIDTEIACSGKTAKEISANGIVQGEGLRQGMPISPYLANLYLAGFDDMIIKERVPMVRYADDLIAFADSSAQCEEIHNKCAGFLNSIGLKIHPLEEGLKTEICPPSKLVEFIGLGLQRSKTGGFELVVTAHQLHEIKRALYEYRDLNFCKKRRITISRLLASLNSKLIGYQEAYSVCSNSQKFNDSLQGYRRRVLEDVYRQHFKIDLGELTKNEKHFLEIGDWAI